MTQAGRPVGDDEVELRRRRGGWRAAQQVAGGGDADHGLRVDQWPAGRDDDARPGKQIGYGYANGRITGITVNGSPLVAAGDYEPFGPVSVWQWGNGHRTYRDHDSDGRLSSWEYRNGASILRRDLTWDDGEPDHGGQRPGRARPNSGTYGYDALDRLTSALRRRPDTRAYGYDAIGNRTDEHASTPRARTTATRRTSHRLRDLTGATTTQLHLRRRRQPDAGRWPDDDATIWRTGWRSSRRGGDDAPRTSSTGWASGWRRPSAARPRATSTTSRGG